MCVCVCACVRVVIKKDCAGTDSFFSSTIDIMAESAGFIDLMKVLQTFEINVF